MCPGSRLVRVVFFLVVGSTSVLLASNRYALILQDEPAGTRHGAASLSVEAKRATIEAAQRTLRTELARRQIQVTGSAQSLLNAVFVLATPDQEATLASLPGVKAVVKLRMAHPNLNRAAPLVNAPAAWNALGGAANAGLGVKIGIIDTGIDQTHPAFGDTSLPSVTPICNGDDCSFTNAKVIVARSYVKQLAAGTPPNPAADSRPDDYSPRDHVGHGTAVAMVAAGMTNTGPAATITGIAPKAYLGNYKVYGSPGVNDGASEDVLIQAVEDAFNDGMDIVNVSSGLAPLSGPLDTGPACGMSAGVNCDLVAVTYENAAKNGMVVVAAAGNDGQNGEQFPTLSSVESPADAPSVIGVAASSNSHAFFNGISVNGPNVPSNLQSIAAEFGDGPVPATPLTAPLKDAAGAGDGTACQPLTAGSLSGYIAIVQRSPACSFAVKVQNAQTAGALAVIFTLASASDSLVVPGGLTNTTIPAVLISYADGQNLRAYVSANAQATATIDATTLVAVDAQADIVAPFSSRGPALDGTVSKPDITAVGTDIYMAAQKFDPNGVMYSPNGYTAQSGTSFSSPMVAGAAALVKQSHGGYSPAQVKSALVNTANATALSDPTPGTAANVIAMGAGKLDAGAAVASTIAVAPSSVFLGVLKAGTTPQPIALTISNSGTAAANLQLTAAGTGSISLDQSSLTVAAGQTQTVNVSLGGAVPPAGDYQGQIAVTGASGALHIPYSYAVGSGTAFNLTALAGDQNLGTVGQVIPDGAVAFQVTDRYGAPVANLPVQFTARGGGAISQPDSMTNQYGIAMAVATLGPTPGNYTFIGSAGGLSYAFQDQAIAQPTISSAGVVNAASTVPAQGVAPGSYVSIYGSNISLATDVASAANLPLSLDGVSVSFDIPSAGISVPGYLYYVSPGQVNIQVPWELEGQSSAQVKVSIGSNSGNVVTVPLAAYSPGIFLYGQSQAAALDENGNLIGASNPAQRGHVISIYANGLGPVANQPASGMPAPSSPLATTQSQPTVTIGGVATQVQFSGLAPQFTGLYQVNVTVPAGAATGSQPVVLSIGGVNSNTANIALQ